MSDGDEPRRPGNHPFVVQLDWLLLQAGGKEKLAELSGVSVRTLGNWSSGRVPEKAVTGAVRALDRWAAQTLPGYPEEAGVPRLVDSCGPRAAQLSAPPAGTAGADSVGDRDAAADPGDAPVEPVGATATGRRTRPSRLVVAALAGAAAALAVAGTVAAVVLDDEELATAGAGSQEDEELPPLPVSASEPPRDELTGSIGANAFSDPRTLTDRAPMIPPDTVVSVRCRFYAPSIPSVEPDGYWYLIDSGEWAGLWSPANSYMNGDVPGGPYTHNTDFEVPECR